MSETGNNIDTTDDIEHKTQSISTNDTDVRDVESQDVGAESNIGETLNKVKLEDALDSVGSSQTQQDFAVPQADVEVKSPNESALTDESLQQTEAGSVENAVTSEMNSAESKDESLNEKTNTEQGLGGTVSCVAVKSIKASENEGSNLDCEWVKYQDEGGSEGVQNTEETSSSITANNRITYEDNQIYNVKWVKYLNNNLPIITQNENGPCPLLAILNYLLLQQKITLPSSTELVTSGNLTSYLADYIFEHVPKHISADTRLNYEQKMNDAMTMFPKLQTGLDVNVRFTGVTHFEYTSSCEVFDLLDIPLYHTWLVDPETPEVVAAVGNATYNQLVEEIINYKSSLNDDQAGKALLAEEFLRTSASQMTYHGLCELSSTLQDSTMGILFRNNHFHTLLKHNGELYVLATDQGFLNEPGVVWETLSNIEGDSHFVDANFRVFQQLGSSPKPPVQMPAFANTKEQIDRDRELARCLQKEEEESAKQLSPWPSHGLSDHEYALRLQEEENRLAEAPPMTTDRHQTPTTGQQRQRVTSAPAGTAKDKKDFSCVVM